MGLYTVQILSDSSFFAFMTDYKKLKVWTAALEMLEAMYDLTANYPKQETYVLTSQTRRAGVSVLANIAEGLGRGHKKDTIHFLIIARGSAYEVEALICMARQVRIINDNEVQKIGEQLTTILKMLNGLIRYVNEKYT